MDSSIRSILQKGKLIDIIDEEWSKETLPDDNIHIPNHQIDLFEEEKKQQTWEDIQEPKEQ